MKQLVVALLCAVFTLSTAYAQDAKKKKDTVTFYVEGMECANCQKKVEKNIAFEKGVTDLKCDLTTRTMEVTYKNDKTSKTKLASAFKKIGMEAVPVDDGAGCPVNPVKKVSSRSPLTR
ncbi:MAG: heavy-metal-associated domain-containing protein [Parabacteroides sp.]|nr:heavy-metal-associated domain-containing protein [Parabacteroides sp.]